MTDKTYCIYKHISPSGKIYIGQTRNIKGRWAGNGTQYLHKYKNGVYTQRVFAQAILKYGWSNFKHEIIMEGLSKSHADYAETYLITWYKLHDRSYNMAQGGTGCDRKHTYTLEDRQRMSEYMKQHSPMKGKHHTPEAMAKIVAANRNREYTPEQRERMRQSGCRLGAMPVTAERRKKYSDYRKAHPETWVGGWNKKKVFQYNLDGKFITEYMSATQAAKALGRNNNSCDIMQCANGIVASAFGYIWRTEKVEHIDMSKYKVVVTKHGARLYDMSEQGKLKRRIGHGKPVNQYSLDGKYITTLCIPEKVALIV